MTDQIEDQDVELEEEIQEAQDPKATSEPASLQSVDAASDAVKGKAKSRKGDKANSEPMQKIKTKAGMINAAYDKMSRMKKEDLRVALSKLMGEDVDLSVLDDDVIAESPDVSYDYIWLLGVPFGLYLAFFCGVGTAGVWWGLSVGLIMAASLLGSRAWKMTSVSNLR